MANRVNPINPADVNMKVNIAGVEFNNPVTVASGTFGSGMEYCEYVDLNKLGAVTTKGVANVPWPGNPTPRIAETYGGMINAIGLQNPGLDTFVKRDIPFLKQYDTKIIVNVLIRDTASAPPASTALAISVISVTLGLNFIITGCLATFFTAFVIRSAEAGTCPKAIPPSFTLGQDMLISSISTGCSPNFSTAST